MRCHSLLTPILLIALGGSAALAHETDQYTLPRGREFADLGPYVSRWMYGAIDRGVQKANANIRDAVDARLDKEEIAARQSHEALVNAVNRELPWAMDVIEGWEHRLNSAELQRRFPGRVIGYKDQIVNIYQGAHLPIDPRQFFRLFLSSTMKAYGVYLGTDKIGHFTDMGMNYYREYARAIRDGQTEEQATAHAVFTGTHGLIFSERGMLGFMTAGAYSNGDLAANYLGLLFYRNLAEPVMLKGSARPPLCVRNGDYWRLADHVTRDSDFFEVFVSNHLNEALNPSLYEAGMRNHVRGAIRERRGTVLEYHVDDMGFPRSPEFFDQLAKELSTYWGADYGHLGEADQLLTIGRTCLSPDEERPNTPPRPAKHVADTLRRTAQLDSANINAADADGRTALHYAAMTSNQLNASTLIRRGASVNTRDAFGLTPLHLAASQKELPVVQALLKGGADISATDDFGLTPLHDAVKDSTEPIVRQLLDSGAQVGVTDAFGTTPLHLACRHSRGGIVKLLLASGADAAVRNAAGTTPLHEAALAGDQGIIRMLLDAGAKPAAPDNRGRTPAEVARDRGYRHVAELLE